MKLPRFFTRWRREIRRQIREIQKSPSSRESDLWEGHLACKELKRAGLLRTAMLEAPSSGKKKVFIKRDWRFADELNHIHREVMIYLDHRGKVVAWNQEATKLKRSFLKMEKECKSLRGKLKTHDFQEMLFRYIVQLSKDISRMGRVWQGPLGVWGEVLNKPKPLQKPYREMDLDTRFQIRVARLLRFSLCTKDCISLQTVARLVLLVYLVAGLLEDRKDKAIILHSQHELKVPDIAQTLRRTGKLK
jgi:hypothetical protein